MSSNDKKLHTINQLCGKNRTLQALRKSGVLYRRAARLQQDSQNVANISNAEPGNTLSASGQQVVSEYAVEYRHESASSYVNESTSSIDEQNVLVEWDSDNDLEIDPNEQTEDKSDEDEDDDPDFSKMTSEDCLRYWALAGNESHESIKRMLKIMRATVNPNLPKDPRTILRTERNPAILTNIGSGQYWYYGIRRCLVVELKKQQNVPHILQFDLNVDGLPLHKRTKTEFWPILLKVVGQPDWPVMIVAIYSGPSKPISNEDFLRPLVDEINDLFITGLVLEESTTIRVHLRAIIADTPARAFIKGVQGHSGKNSCMKCCCVGETVENRRVFLDTRAVRREDQAFRNREYVLHQIRTTPLVDLRNFDIIKDIIVGDSLHQIDLGVTKKLLFIWYFGVPPGSKRWNVVQRARSQRRLANQTYPVEINRKLRLLDDLTHWKGSDCKTFLHYAAPVVLKDILTTEEYEHFMLFFCSITIFSSTAHKKHWSAASDMLEKFVLQYPDIYSMAGVTMNVHSLIHIHEEAIRFGAMGNYSTYVFERKLGIMKRKLIRTNYKCLEQAIRRILELESFEYPQNRRQYTGPSYKQRGESYTLNLRRNFKLKNDDVNCWFMTKENEIFKFMSVKQVEQKHIITAAMFSRVYEYFNQHISSNELFIYAANINDLLCNEIELDSSDIKLRLAKTVEDRDGKVVFFPILSTLDE